MNLHWCNIQPKEALSRLWAYVYALRANILRVERLEIWPHDPTEPSTSEQVLAEEIDARDYELASGTIPIQRHINDYGEYINHGEGEFNAEAFLLDLSWSCQTICTKDQDFSQGLNPDCASRL